ncbi:NADPH-dependent F420 reductase [Streptomyces zingiberis]|uniref:NADPH-dependent F420 reductase n=1 Tax=Streptomyces zingiberis TaxID=2053010 RepID=A0ABX1C300_9ACTN|nr:NADPH-dependent F420 reductase [Streptomyces zingiberis]NJQ02500.1 NADPH-dependent F420 reductase [Streptomyces zingiberis]
MTTLGLIGSGNIGSTVARLAIEAGLQVVVSNSRGPETLVGLVQELGDRARAGTAEEAAADGDLVVLSVPFKAYREVPAELLAGKVVLETLNYYPQRDGDFPELDADEITSSELVQGHLAGAKVVKVFNNIYFGHLLGNARPSGDPDRSALPIAGDDADAKEQATRLLDRLGWDTVDAGTLADSWRFQPDTPAYGGPYMADPGVGVEGIAEDPGTPAQVEKVEAALAAARR